MAGTTEIDTANHPFNWANDTFMALNDPSCLSPEKWAAMSQPQSSLPPSAFTFPPSLLSQSSIERFGQITPPADSSCEDQQPSMKRAREDSIPVEELQNEISWPGAQEMQALADYQPDSINNQQPHELLATPTELDQSTQERASKRRRTSKQSTQPATEPSQPIMDNNLDPPKRKRGRPKSQPQVAYNADGYPFQVSSARQSHLEKNRVAAHKCRQRKKEYINGLEGRAREFSAKNKALKDNVAMLREEVLGLKNEVLRHAGCGFWAVDEYLARCAGDLLGMDRPPMTSTHQPQNPSPTMSTLDVNKLDREASADSFDSHMSMTTPDDQYDGLDLLEDIDEDLE